MGEDNLARKEEYSEDGYVSYLFFAWYLFNLFVLQVTERSDGGKREGEERRDEVR
jgi:hypothetical protein